MNAGPIAAFDVDGTITRHPALFAGLVRALKAYGWITVALTGGLDPHPDGELLQRAQANRRQQLDELDVRVDLVVCCIGRSVAEVARMKGLWCNEHQAHVVVEDSAEYVAAIRQLAPDTAVLVVAP